MTSTYHTAPQAKNVFGPQTHSTFEIATQDGNDTWILYGQSKAVNVNAEYPEPEVFDFTYDDAVVKYNGPSKVTVSMELVPDSNGVMYTLTRKIAGSTSKHFPNGLAST